MKHRAAILSAIIGTLALGLIVLFGVAGPDTGGEGRNPLVGRPAPSITATDTEGRAFRMADYRGRWVLVNFFATWCAPCVAEHPELVAFSERHRRSGDALVVSVAYNQKAQEVKDFFAANGGDWAVIAAGADDFSLEYGVVQLPESYLIDPDGVVVHKFIGGLTAAAVDRWISRAARAPGAATGGGR